MIISLAQELTEHEMAHPGSRPSDLYQLVDAYVDDPEFWFHVTQMKEKLHLHVKPYMRQTFIEKARSQLNRLSGQRYRLKSAVRREIPNMGPAWTLPGVITRVIHAF